jgi:hypothetical protein
MSYWGLLLWIAGLHVIEFAGILIYLDCKLVNPLHRRTLKNTSDHLIMMRTINRLIDYVGNPKAKPKPNK